MSHVVHPVPGRSARHREQRRRPPQRVTKVFRHTIEELTAHLLSRADDPGFSRWKIGAIATLSEDKFMSTRDPQSANERQMRIDGDRSGDAARLAEVESLVEASGNARSLPELPARALDVTVDMPSAGEGPHTVIGSYKLLEEIGEGGFGVVFMAEQIHPVRRSVALKVLKPGMDTRQVVARFEAERQALALMDHPNIAKVFDAGTTALGRPYFVMELVKGVPLTEFCDQKQLRLRQRLELFVTVCQAVQHAHQKGIIHRDLKPSNILVTVHGTTPVTKVIDFGIAKALGQELTDKTLFTGFAQMIGTPLYMSPEQAGESGRDIDTRSDIYSLGVLLYELLVGSTPINQERFKQARYDEIRRTIRDVEPPKPSARLSESKDSLQSISAWRQTEPARLTKLVRGELDWIAMKALEKDRNRRYETAGALAADVQRYLKGEAVQACPTSTWYRLRKLAWRNRGTFAGVSAVALLLVLTVITLAVSNSWIRREQARTKQEKIRAEKAQDLAEGRAKEIRLGLERLKTANALLDRGRWYASEGQWDDAHEAFSQAIELHPDHVSVWVDRADLYTRLGLWDLATADYTREMELREPDTTLRWYQHALLRRASGDLEGCRQTVRAMRERFAGTLNDRFVEEIVRSSVLVSDPAADLHQLVELSQKAIPGRPCSMLYVLGAAHYRTGQYDDAVQRLQEALLAQLQWPIRLLSYPVLAMAHHRLGHETEARQALDEAAAILDRWTEERYAGHGGSWAIRPGGEAVWPVAWWDYLECQLLYGQAKQLIDGAPPPDDARLHVLRARAFAGLDWVEQAASEFDAALRLSPHEPRVLLEAYRNRGKCCVERHQWRDAAAAFGKATELRPEDACLWRFQAVAHFADRNVDAYRETCTSMLERFAQTEDRFVAGNVLLACVLRDDALPDMEQLVPLMRVSDPLWHWGDGVRGAALYRVGRYDECVRCFETAARMCRPRAWDWCFLAMARHRLRDDKEARRCLSEAKRWIDAANHHTEDDPSGTQPVWGGWHEPVVYSLLLREAEEFVEGTIVMRSSQRGPYSSGATRGSQFPLGHQSVVSLRSTRATRRAARAANSSFVHRPWLLNASHPRPAKPRQRRHSTSPPA
jgi:serine/threonine protein kinase/predicted Zn-dependent protease